MIEEYLISWEKFRAYCEKKAKDRCIINTTGWRKLMEFHLVNYLESHKNPYLFLLTTKWKYSKIFLTHRMSRYYHYYARKRFEVFDSNNLNLISYPTWKGK